MSLIKWVGPVNSRVADLVVYLPCIGSRNKRKNFHGVYQNLHNEIKPVVLDRYQFLGELNYACQVLAFLYRQGRDSSYTTYTERQAFKYLTWGQVKEVRKVYIKKNTV